MDKPPPFFFHINENTFSHYLKIFSLQKIIMTSTLSVIALVTRLRSTSHTVNGDAMYREKISNQNHVFTFKQFVNAHHEYNESFKEGDLVLFGGKFTLDEKKNNGKLYCIFCR